MFLKKNKIDKNNKHLAFESRPHVSWQEEHAPSRFGFLKWMVIVAGIAIVAGGILSYLSNIPNP